MCIPNILAHSCDWQECFAHAQNFTPVSRNTVCTAQELPKSGIISHRRRRRVIATLCHTRAESEVGVGGRESERFRQGDVQRQRC